MRVEGLREKIMDGALEKSMEGVLEKKVERALENCQYLGSSSTFRDSFSSLDCGTGCNTLW
jgi:hypothetical protein